MFDRSPLALSLALVVASAALAGCGIVIDGEELGEDDGVEADLAEYAELVEALEDDRELALPAEATQVSTAGPWLAWIEGETLGLRRYPDRFELALPAGDAYRIGSERVITATAVGAGLELDAYALGSAESLGSTMLPEASPGVALALMPASEASEARAWVVDGGQVWAWSPAEADVVALGSLADAGVGPGSVVAIEAWTPDASPVLLVHVEGQLWAVEPETWTASVLVALDELLAVGPRGILHTHADGLFLLEPDGVMVRVDEAVAASGYALNPTFAQIHEVTGEGATLADDRVVYVGSAGLFAFDLDREGAAAISPVLIEPRWDVSEGVARIEYREPLVAGATVFTRGLTGEAGEVGTTGPVYAAPLPP